MPLERVETEHERPRKIHGPTYRDNYDRIFRKGPRQDTSTNSLVSYPSEDNKVYFMRENHTFRRLDEGKIITQALEQFDSGQTWGMLCAVLGGKSYPGVVHAHGKASRDEFEASLKAWVLHWEDAVADQLKHPTT